MVIQGILHIMYRQLSKEMQIHGALSKLICYVPAKLQKTVVWLCQIVLHLVSEGTPLTPIKISRVCLTMILSCYIWLLSARYV